jgi:hypothetical protein
LVLGVSKVKGRSAIAALKRPWAVGFCRAAPKTGQSEKAADPKAGGVSGASSDDVTAVTRFLGVGGDRFVGFEVQVALDR